ncbi:MAG: Lrp/AsnC family transcriptional regulator [Oscillospiraceae bacterium]|nr:Lrp/AsnC family transcriptional regulator [Oscillospiraceae bacterium]
MRKDILSLLERDAKLTPGEIAVLLGLEETAVREEIEALEREQIICGYGAFVNRDRAGSDDLTALIEVRVTPSRGQGFNHIAERIGRFDEVRAVYLMSGGYDLAVLIEGKSIKDISYFVSDKLSALDSILSTATHFVMKRYKDHGVMFDDADGGDERMIVSP